MSEVNPFITEKKVMEFDIIIEVMCTKTEVIELARKLFDDYDTDCSKSLSRA